MRIPLIAILMLPTVIASATAFADEKGACLAATSSGQRLRGAHKLVEAREQFRICAAASCPAVLQSDCAGWLVDVEKALPTIVVTAKNGNGADLVDVSVTVDGKPFATKLNGEAVAIDPGAHVLHFAGDDGVTLDQHVVVVEGEQNQRITAVLGKAAATTTGPGTASGTVAGATGATGEAGAKGSTSVWKTVGWVMGGAGVVGLGIGAVFGAMAISDNNAAHCNASNQCEASPLSSARSAAVGSDIGLIAGGVLLAGGAALVLFGPSGGAPDRVRAGATAAIAPFAGPAGGGVVVAGSW